MVPEVAGLVPVRLLRAMRAVPLSRENVRGRGTLVVAMADPGDLRAVDELAFATGMRIRPVSADETDILRALGAGREPSPAREEALTLIDIGPVDEEPPASGLWLLPVAEET